ncbi:MAG TPA: SIS domain-containing protein [Clostridia bacterium]|nr:SIS domain-containing protein [Clostridia bacterium]
MENRPILYEPDEKIQSDLSRFLDSVRTEINKSISTMDSQALTQAAELILAAQRTGGRLHITGIGKPAHLANYAASLLSSTGTPAYFLHGTEAVHGSCGQLVAGDVVICISNSGETSEMRATVTAILNNGCSVIGISRNPDSWLAQQAHFHVTARVENEGDDMGRAPRNSFNVETLVVQALSIILQSKRNLTVQEYIQRHPGGQLGKTDYR